MGKTSMESMAYRAASIHVGYHGEAKTLQINQWITFSVDNFRTYPLAGDHNVVIGMALSFFDTPICDTWSHPNKSVDNPITKL